MKSTIHNEKPYVLFDEIVAVSAKLMLILAFAIVAFSARADVQKVSSSDEEARFALHGRPAPENFEEFKANSLNRQKALETLNSDEKSYPPSIGGSKKFEYISSFTITPKDGCYKISVKVVCPRLYDEDDPNYAGVYEYVNVWIDWNGDYTWSDSEWVMAKLSDNYRKILADNRILYFEATVKDVSTVSGTYKARAMLGWGYNPTNPATYSWTWGDVQDIDVNFDMNLEFNALKFNTLGVRPTGENSSITKENVVIAGTVNYVVPEFRVKTADVEKVNFSEYTVKVLSTDYKVNYPFERSVRQVEWSQEGTLESQPYEEKDGYSIFKVKGQNSQELLWVPEVSTDKTQYGPRKMTVSLFRNGEKQFDVERTYFMFYSATMPLRQGSTPMWYHMWKGVVPHLEDFSFDDSDPLNQGNTRQFHTFDPYPHLEGAVAGINWTFTHTIGSGAWEILQGEDLIQFDNFFKESEVKYPIDEVFRTVDHERWHKILTGEYNVGSVMKMEDQFFIAYLNDNEGKPVFDGEEQEWKWGEGDLLMPAHETEMGASPDDDKTDTYGISTKGPDFEIYESYGDQEVYCRWKSDMTWANQNYYTSDWSFPGAQLSDDASAGGGNNAELTKHLFEEVASNLSTNSPESAIYSSVLLSQSWADDVMNRNNFSWSKSTPDISFMSFRDVTRDFVSEGLVFDVIVSHNLKGRFSFDAYLFGTNNIAIARAHTKDTFDESKTNVVFVFSSDIIAQTREYYAGPYVLGLVECIVPHHSSANARSSKNVLITDDYSAYECKVTKTFIGNAISDYSDDDGLHVVMPLTVPTAGTYTISAHLATTNGVNIVNVSTNCVCAEGKNSIDICFPNDAVFITKIEGNFMVRDVSVAAEGEDSSLFVVDYVTGEYDFYDFWHEDKTIYILPEEITVSTVKDDDGSSDLFKGVALHFEVFNYYYDYTLYRVSATLVDSNGYYVAHAQEDLMFYGYYTYQTLFFSALDIRESGKDGPYYVKNIRITDRTTGELIDACAVSPARTEIVTASDFKGGLTIDEDGITVAARKASTGLIKCLDLNVPLDSPSAGYVTMTARVKTSSGDDVGLFEDDIEVKSGQNTVTLELEGGQFLDSKLNGPYFITLTLYHSSNPEVSYDVERVIQTDAYKYSDFTRKVIVTFDANDGTVSPETLTLASGETVGTLPVPTKTGHTFDGWFTALSGGKQITAATVVTESVTYYAHWTPIKYTVTFDPNGGTVSETTRIVAYGEYVGTLPVPKLKYHAFDGWYTAPYGGYYVSYWTEITSDVTFYAQWIDETRHINTGYYGSRLPFSQNYTFNSFLQTSNNGDFAGTVTIKTRKAKNGIVTATVTIKPVVGKKQTIKGTISAYDGRGQGALSGLTFTSEGVTGTLNGYSVDGSLDESKAKNSVYAAVLNNFKGKSFNLTLEPLKATGSNSAKVNGKARFTIVFAAKGKAKVKGTLPEGTKVSLSSQLIVGSEWCCLPLSYSKTSSFAFVMWFSRYGYFDSLSGMTPWKGNGFEVIWKDEDVEISAISVYEAESFEDDDMFSETE